MTWKETIKHLIPPVILNNFLLAFPGLYGTRLVNYETPITAVGIEDLTSMVEKTAALSGDIIECGSSRCGASIHMARRLGELGVRKTIYACDSFEGFDREELRRDTLKGWTNVSERAFTSTSYDYVQKKLAKLGLTGQIKPIQGYFQNTLPSLNARFCLVFIDCDLHDSMLYCAKTLWPRLSPGGYMIFDDYNDPHFSGAALAVDEFVREMKGEIASHGLMQRMYCAVKR